MRWWRFKRPFIFLAYWNLCDSSLGKLQKAAYLTSVTFVKENSFDPGCPWLINFKGVMMMNTFPIVIEHLFLK